MSKTFVAVADAAVASFYTCRGAGAPLSFKDKLAHEEGRAHARDLVTDRGGQMHDGASSSPHRHTPSSNPRDVEERAFARRIAAHVEEALRAGEIDELVLAMPPRLLGMVREALSHGAAAKVTLTLHNRLVDLTLPDIADHLRAARANHPHPEGRLP